MNRDRFSVEPLEQGMSFKAKAYQSLRQAITQMNIYGQSSEIRLDMMICAPVDRPDLLPLAANSQTVWKAAP